MPTEQIDLSRIRESKTNPRTGPDGPELKELAESIRKRGVLQALIVRPLEGKSAVGYEIVCGHRRFRAVQMTDLTSVPCDVRRLDDQAAKEIQLIENLQREDLHPLDEGQQYRQLVKERNLTVEIIAGKVGKSPAFVRQRLQLTALSVKCRHAFQEKKISLGTALRICRLGSQEDQDKVLTQFFQGTRGDEGYTSEVMSRFMLNLTKAPFSPDDPDLLRKAGTCKDCPKRTGNEPALFKDIKGGDVCTDSVCYREKLQAHVNKILSRTKSEGKAVMSSKDTANVFYSLSHFNAGVGEPARVKHDSRFVALDGNLSDLNIYMDKHEGKQLATLLGKDPEGVVLAVDPAGFPRRLIERKAAVALLEKAKLIKVGRDGGARLSSKKEIAARKLAALRARIRAIAALKMLAEIRTRAAKPMNVRQLREVALALMGHSLNVAEKDMLRARAMDAKGDTGTKIKALIGKAKTAGECMAWITEIAVVNSSYYGLVAPSESVYGHDSYYARGLVAIGNAFGLNMKQQEAKARADVQKAKSAKKPARKGKGKK